MAHCVALWLVGLGSFMRSGKKGVLGMGKMAAQPISPKNTGKEWAGGSSFWTLGRDTGIPAL